MSERRPLLEILFVLAASVASACGGHVDLGRDDGGPSDDALATLTADVASDTSIGEVGPDAVSTIDTAPCTPPTFGGALSVDEVDARSIRLHWAAAIDDTTPAADIVYVVFVAKAGSSPTTTSPALITAPGATSAVIRGLLPDTDYAFSVRARDSSSCLDENVAEVAARTSTSCSFALDVQPLFNRACAVAGCHVLPAPTGGLVLSSGFAYSNLVGVLSGQDLSQMRVKPGDAEASYLYRKITGRPFGGFLVMPPPGATSLPSAEEKDRIRCWIDRGALDD